MNMNYEKFFDGMEDIFAAFGKKMPEDRIVQAIYKRVMGLPDGFMDFAVRHFEDEEQLPRNMGRYLLRELWPEYLSRNPDLKTTEHALCPNCDKDMPGYRKIYKYEVLPGGKAWWKPVIVRCTCGKAPNPSQERIFEDFELESMGFSLKPRLTPEQEQGFAEWKSKFLENLDEAKTDTMDPDFNNKVEDEIEF